MVFFGSEVSKLENSAILPKNSLLKPLFFNTLTIPPLYLCKRMFSQLKVLRILFPFPTHVYNFFCKSSCIRKTSRIYKYQTRERAILSHKLHRITCHVIYIDYMIGSL